MKANDLVAPGMLEIIGIAAENAGIKVSDSRLLHFISNLQDEEIFLVNKNNTGILFKNGKFTDQIEFISRNGLMVQINL